MLCEKCGTENKEGTSYCKKCGEDLVQGEKENDVVEAAKTEENSVAATKTEERLRTSPLAVRMQEKGLKEDKKIRKKLKRGKVWAALAIIFIVLFLAENTGIILSELGYINLTGTEIETEEQAEEIAPPVEEIPVLGSETLEGDWTYTYTLKKNWDSDVTGDYETVTETIVSNGEAFFADKGENHLSAFVMSGEMTVNDESVALGTVAEAFSAWYEEGYMCIQMKGTEQKFFAPGGSEPLVIKIPVTMDEAGVITGGTYSHTYDKVVTEMNMRYEIEITLEKK